MAAEANAANAAAEHGLTSGQYIIHHLTHLRNKEFKGTFDLSVVSWDSMFFSIVIGVLGCFLLWRKPRSSCTTPPAASWSRRWP